MGMSRHMYWLILLNMIANVVAYVPRILLEERFTGMVLGIVIATAIGVGFILWYTKLMTKFPGQGIPELLQARVPAWFRILFLFIHGISWFFAGFITLVAFSDITKRFINPDMSMTTIALLFGLAVGGGALLETRALLFLLEVLLLIDLPFIALVFVKAFTNNFFNWDMVAIVSSHFYELPSWTTLSAAFYTFLGFTNLAIFNRVIPKLERKWLWLTPILGLINLFTTAFVPIGMNGTLLVGDFVFPWLSTADTLRMEFGFVERVLFIFLLLYIGISLLSIIIHWHVGLEWFKSFLPPLKRQGRSYTPLLVMFTFIVIAGSLTILLNTVQIYEIAKLWLASLIPFTLFICLFLTWLARRKSA